MLTMLQDAGTDTHSKNIMPSTKLHLAEAKTAYKTTYTVNTSHKVLQMMSYPQPGKIFSILLGISLDGSLILFRYCQKHIFPTRHRTNPLLTNNNR